MSSETLPASTYRLPTDVLPKHYEVTIRTNLEREVFEGIIIVHLNILEPTNTITFNANESLSLSVAALALSSSDGSVQSLKPTNKAYDSKTERVSYSFADTLAAGTNATLRVGFTGVLEGGMTGYYKSTWDKGIYSLTQFEATYARKAIPCWDEPLLKATFAVTMISQTGTVSLSNMPAIDTSSFIATPALVDDFEKALYSGVESGEWTVTRFETTPPMSTYLLAYANGPFKYIESSYTSPLSGKVRPLRVYTTEDKIHQAQFALDVKRRVMPIYEEVFDVEYPLPKLDTLVANDFDAGAMENWGLITGRTSAFLVDPNGTGITTKKRVAGIQSHEVAHMWFGNIATMEWWSYLWLNEGFATMMGQNIIIDKIFPEWKVDSEFVTNQLNKALRLDAKLSSHPVEVDCPDANKIGQIFDNLSYAKGASVLRMLSYYVGEPKFLKGVSLYLKSHLYGNSTTADLWEGLSQASGTDIGKVMENWITKIGFPVVTVSESEDGTKIKVRQDRFLEDGPAEPKDNETIWTIPLSLLKTNADGTLTIDRSIILNTREAEFDVDTRKPWKLNADSPGVFRVLYTPQRLSLIAHEAAKTIGSAFSLNDRIGLVHDAMAFAKSGHLKISAALELVNILRSEREFLVWDGISQNLSNVVDTWWENTDLVEALNVFRRELYVPLVKKLGFEYSDQDDADTSELRTRAIEQAALAKDPGTIQELQQRFARYAETDDDHAIPADLLKITFQIAIQYGGSQEYNAVAKLYDNPKTPSVQAAAIRALGATQDKELIDRTFEIAMKARDQDVMFFLFGIGQGNPKFRRELMWFFEENYHILDKRFEGNFTMRYFVQASYENLSTKQDVQHIEEFFKDKDTSKYSQALAQALDSIKARAAWIERSTEDLTSWLNGAK
ncbi:leucyl aminopeptidase [Stereum hirsutum FP-91666 SS1]|uniref:leucyl aminopeptidase n=1 Tax=Stereum hirsutum (strain FP-91666) TaxID=721885 RepID=UPI000440A281|nr:leucyl aminopeptidase [Stereum hirsutum FP-91666 SS1]EIM90757.1 leucyl aminopeptidase [Stereum hirsutum FP-91666 SS1]